MNTGFRTIRAWMKPLVLIAITVVTYGLLQGCAKVANLTQYVDPCGTVFADCFPGQFQLYASDVPNYDLDPTCTIPGGCLPGGAPSAANPFVSPYAHLHPGASGP